MSNQSIIEHRSNYYYIEFREDYLIMCQQCTYKKPVKPGAKCKATPYCKSLILAIMESWTNDKRGKGSNLAIYMTYQQWIDAMYGMFGRCAIIDSLDELIGEGLLRREPYRMFGKDTYQYFLNYQELNKRIKTLPERAANERHPQVNASTSRRDPSINRRDTHLQVDEDPSTSRYNIDSTKKQNIDSHRGNSASAPTQPISPQKPSLTPSGKHILDLYQHYKKRKVTLTNSTVAAANGLSEVVEQDQDLLDVLSEMEQDDFIRKRDVRIDLDFVHRKYDGYFDVVCRKRAGPLHKSKPAGAQPTVVAAAAKQQERAEALLKRAATH